MTITDVAVHKAKVLGDKEGLDSTYLLVKKVLPEFSERPQAAIEWAKENMTVSDCNLVMIKTPNTPAKEDVWNNGEWLV